jgi:16S rRNA (cytosine1407-C5)-methyltransferase
MPQTGSSNLNESIERFSDILSESERQKILQLQDQPSPIGIRLNPLKLSPQQAIQELANRYGWQTQPLSYCQNGWLIRNYEGSPGTTIEHRMGQYYLQDPASMVPVSLFDIDYPNPLILDMAASPGGKTTHLIDRTFDQGFVLANDASRGRINPLRSVLSNWGGINQAILNYPGENFGPWFPETFDFVLLDAPCSMENLRPSPDQPMRETTRDERLRLQERQIQLLKSGLGALKTGGQLVYATCSLAPEEDEAVIDAVLNQFPDAIQVEVVSAKIGFDAKGLTQFQGRTFHPALTQTLRLYPHITGFSGFFCALFKKTQPIHIPQAEPPQRDFTKTHLETIQSDMQKRLSQAFFDQFGLDLEQILERLDVLPYQRYEQFFLIPKPYLEHFSRLPYEYIGMPLGTWQNNTFAPSHPFVSRFGHQFTRGVIVLDDQHTKLWIVGRDIRQPKTDLVPQGQFLLVKDLAGRNLGLGKLLPKRLRNLLPRYLI